MDPQTIVEVDTRIISRISISGSGKSSGLAIDMELNAIASFDDGGRWGEN